MSVSRAALLRIFYAEQGRVVRLIGRIVRCRTTAEDLAHETLLRLWSRPVGADDRSLLFRTAQNIALDHLRAQRVRSDYVRLHAQGEAADASGTLLEAHVDAEHEYDRLVAALQRLPERTQRIFLLNRLDGLSYGEVAAELNLSVSTIEKEMMRALDACRQAVAE